MKQIISLIFIIFGFAYQNSYTQEFVEYLSYNSFEKWIHTWQPKQMSLITAEKNGHEESKNISYAAIFKDEHEQLSITLSEEADFYGFKKVTDTSRVKWFKYKNRTTVFYPLVSLQGMYSVCSILYDNFHASLNITFSRLIPKDKLITYIETMDGAFLDTINNTITKIDSVEIRLNDSLSKPYKLEEISEEEYESIWGKYEDNTPKQPLNRKETNSTWWWVY